MIISRGEWKFTIIVPPPRLGPDYCLLNLHDGTGKGSAACSPKTSEHHFISSA
jgi:hypothetical protein